jgi:UDPglucose--hexose-1-phosphate uridylyltransferase
VERIDPLTGERAWIVASRQGRPNLPSSGCPFCVGGREAPEAYDVRSFPNRWPPFPDDRAEIVLYTPLHDASFADLSAMQARRVVDLWADRSAALGARADVAYVLVFENRGPAVGATIAHPHGQIYAFDVVPPRAATELDVGDPAAGLGPDAPGDRLVTTSSGGWRAWVPWAATWPYELVLAPDRAVPDLPSLSGPGRDGLATLLVDVVGRLDRLFDEPMPFMLWFHQRPFDDGDWPAAWLHAHVAPILRSPGTPRFVAAGELGSGVWFNPIDPADAAERLREV